MAFHLVPSSLLPGAEEALVLRWGYLDAGDMPCDEDHDILSTLPMVSCSGSDCQELKTNNPPNTIDGKG
jgi:hypothetical protein